MPWKNLYKSLHVAAFRNARLQELALRSVHLARFDAWCRAHPCAVHDDRKAMYGAAVRAAGLDDEPIDYLEFGVFEGDSLRWWLGANRHPESRFVGFDTFEGLPEDWTADHPKGAFSTEGRVPRVDDSRASFEVGLFQATLPGFLERSPRLRRCVLHLDADLYSSTLFVLLQLLPRLTAGDVLLFDEFHDYMDEYRALEHALAAYSVELEALAATPGYGGRGYGRVAVRIRA